MVSYTYSFPLIWNSRCEPLPYLPLNPISLIEWPTDLWLHNSLDLLLSPLCQTASLLMVLVLELLEGLRLLEARKGLGERRLGILGVLRILGTRQVVLERVELLRD